MSHIVSLSAENILRLVAVHITPDKDGNLVVISGNNGNGKSSVLASIAMALGGGPEAGRRLPELPLTPGVGTARWVRRRASVGEAGGSGARSRHRTGPR